LIRAALLLNVALRLESLQVDIRGLMISNYEKLLLFTVTSHRMDMHAINNMNNKPFHEQRNSFLPLLLNPIVLNH